MDSPKAYPIDQYLIVDHTKAGIVNILDGDEWSWEPELKPEDEMMLKRLHSMLQSTAEDLKNLSTEIVSSRQNRVQIKTQPTPLDKEFNEKVHIKEAVDAKFNGRILVDNRVKTINKVRASNVINKNEKVIVDKQFNAGVQVNLPSKDFTEIQKIPATPVLTDKIFKNRSNSRIALNRPSNTVHYEELLHKPTESKVTECTPTKKYAVQEMPSVEIRSQLSEQKVVNLNILPDDTTNRKPYAASDNNACIEVQHNTMIENIMEKEKHPHPVVIVTRKVLKLPSYESSVSNGKSNSESDIQISNARASALNEDVQSVNSRKPRRDIHNKGNAIVQKEKDEVNKMARKQTTAHHMSDEWRKRLSVIYGKPSTSNFQRKTLQTKKHTFASQKHTNFKSYVHKSSNLVKQNNVLNNAEYVPYSKLTLGGVNVSDLENEIGNMNNKADLPLSPILDKMLSSQDNSRQQSPRRPTQPNVGPFSKSDENLLKEVLDIDRRIYKTLNKKNNNNVKSVDPPAKTANSMDGSNEDNYDDDFEEVEKSESMHTSSRSDSFPDEHASDNNNNCNLDNNEGIMLENNESHSEKYEDMNRSNKLNIKYFNLSLKTAVDVFEYVHSVDTQDNGTQSNTTQTISLKETQTSPRPDANIRAIHNELWNTSGEVEQMFKVEKDFIKNLIIEEYGDIFELQKNITKPTTSAVESSKSEEWKNVATQPKNTQTSPAHVKSIMTSPFKTKNRTTSPLPKHLTMHRQASPLIVANLDNESTRVATGDFDEPGININLSSPRFNLRLPQSSHEVFSNVDTNFSGEPVSTATPSESKPKRVVDPQDKVTQTSKDRPVSSTESCNEESESDASSLGEINWRLRRGKVLRKGRASTSESSSCSLPRSSSDGFSGNILPVKSEGEISLGQL